MMPRTTFVFFVAFSLLVLGCADDECDDAACLSCFGWVATGEPFPFAESWSGAAVVDDEELAVKITLKPLGPVQSPEQARGDQSEPSVGTKASQRPQTIGAHCRRR